MQSSMFDNKKGFIPSGVVAGVLAPLPAGTASPTVQKPSGGGTSSEVTANDPGRSDVPILAEETADQRAWRRSAFQ